MPTPPKKYWSLRKNGTCLCKETWQTPPILRMHVINNKGGVFGQSCIKIEVSPHIQLEHIKKSHNLFAPSLRYTRFSEIGARKRTVIKRIVTNV